MTTATSHAHGSLRSYLIGFALSLLLTLAAFGAVMLKLIPHQLQLSAIVLCCVVQLVVQLVFFLHIGTAREQRSNKRYSGGDKQSGLKHGQLRREPSPCRSQSTPARRAGYRRKLPGYIGRAFAYRAASRDRRSCSGTGASESS